MLMKRTGRKQCFSMERRIRKTILTEEAESQGEKDRITEMMEFIENHADKILGYDEELVRLLVEKATIFENNVVVRFKSGIEIEV